MVEVYIYRGEDGEKVPESTEKLIVDEGVVSLPDDLCINYGNLKHVTLPNGLIKIGNKTFEHCYNLSEISGGNTLQLIGERAFINSGLEKVEFLQSPSAHHEIMTIGDQAFCGCQLARINLSASTTSIGESAFAGCWNLVEANLSATAITDIFRNAFYQCRYLETVSLPKTLKRIWGGAFHNCRQLVTVVLPLDSHQPIKIDVFAFERCYWLANLQVPKDSWVNCESFFLCSLLWNRYRETDEVLAGVKSRFDGLPIHRMCYDHLTVTVPEFRQCIADHQQEEGSLLLDTFQMTPLHVFFSTPEPRVELLDVLLDSLPALLLLPATEVLKCKDDNDQHPLDYLIDKWSAGAAKVLLQRTFEKCMMDRLVRWGAMSWMETIQRKVQEIVAENRYGEDHNTRRKTLCKEAYTAMEHYENVESISILEMALWKQKLNSGRNDGTKREALDRQEKRCLSGAGIVIPHIAIWLGIPLRTSF